MENSATSHNDGISATDIPMSRRDILLSLRGTQEHRHRYNVYKFDAAKSWILGPFHQPINFDSLKGLRLEDADGCCNRTAPIFALRDINDTGPIAGFNEINMRAPFLTCFMLHMHNYIYHRWFRPYKSEIDRGQFLTKMNLPPVSELPQKTDLRKMVSHVRRLSANLVSRVKYTKEHECSTVEKEAGQTFYYLQPLFEAVAIAIFTKDFDFEKPDVASLNILIVRTGIEKGLSAPITFDAIPSGTILSRCWDDDGRLSVVETTLEIAITFLLGLEQRELQAFGPRPDPKATTQNMAKPSALNLYGPARELGWNKKMGKLNGPSSAWVDTTKQKNWSGRGFKLDKWLREDEETLFRIALQFHQLLKEDRAAFLDKENEKVGDLQIAGIKNMKLGF